jgi:glutamate--cysteine ligase
MIKARSMRLGIWSRIGPSKIICASAAPCPRHGLQTAAPGGGDFQALAKRVLAIAHDGLAARDEVNSMGENETAFLNPLHTIADTGKSPADVLLDKYEGEWGGDLSRIYDEMSF